MATRGFKKKSAKIDEIDDQNIELGASLFN
jgi:hypothetical protein